jgi:hypothetical protein
MNFSDIAMKTITGASILNQFYLHCCLTCLDYCHLMVTTWNNLQKTRKMKRILKWAASGDCFICVYCVYYTMKWIWRHNLKRLVGLFGYLPSSHSGTICQYKLARTSSGFLTYRKRHCLWRYGVLHYPSTYNGSEVITLGNNNYYLLGCDIMEHSRNTLTLSTNI